MKLRNVALLALVITIGPIGWGKLGMTVATGALSLGASPTLAWHIGVMFVAFPFFFGAVWVLTNMDTWERVLRVITGTAVR